MVRSWAIYYWLWFFFPDFDFENQIVSLHPTFKIYCFTWTQKMLKSYFQMFYSELSLKALKVKPAYTI